MLDLDQPESKKMMEACFLIDEISKSYSGILHSDSSQREFLFGSYRLKLGQVGLLADEILPADKRELANHNIKLLYKILTGQVSATEEDFSKIEELLNVLSNDCFSCWCI